MKNGTLTLAGALFQEAYICASTGATPRDYNSRPQGPDFQPELTPVHSPLLRGSCLVSCPPLTYMLKFSGFANLTSCLERRCCCCRERQQRNILEQSPIYRPTAHSKQKDREDLSRLAVEAEP